MTRVRHFTPEVDSDDEDIKAKASRLQEEMDNPNRRRSDGSPSGRRSGSSSPRSNRGGDGPGGLLDDWLGLDLGGPSEPAAAAPPVQMQPLVAATQAGSAGKAGLELSGAMVRRGGNIQLMLQARNASQQVLTDWAVHFNKSTFGLAPPGSMGFPAIQPGQTASTQLQLAANQPAMLSGTPVTNPPLLQVALKTSIDVFYFNVKFDLSVLLLETGAVDTEKFREIWQRVGDANQVCVGGNSANGVLTPAGIQNDMAGINCNFVASRESGDNDFLYFAATMTNNALVLFEIMLTKGTPALKLSVRTETPAMVPLVQAQIAKMYNIR